MEKMSKRFEDIFLVVWGIIYTVGIFTAVVSVILYELLVWLTGWKYSDEQPWWFTPLIILVSLVIVVVYLFFRIKRDTWRLPHLHKKMQGDIKTSKHDE